MINTLHRQADKPLPYPFCGEEAVLWATVDTEWVQCSACHASSDVADVLSGLALAAWNHRTTTAATTLPISG